MKLEIFNPGIISISIQTNTIVFLKHKQRIFFKIKDFTTQITWLYSSCIISNYKKNQYILMLKYFVKKSKIIIEN